MRLDLLKQILVNGQRIGAIFCDIFIEDRHKYKVNVDNSEEKRFSYGAETGMGIRLIFEDGRDLNIISNNLTNENLRRISNEILNLSPNSYTQLQYTHSGSINLLSKNQRWLHTFNQLNDVKNSTIEMKISSLKKKYNWEEKKIIIINSEGLYREEVQIRDDIEISMTMKDEKGNIYSDSEFFCRTGESQVEEQEISQMLTSVFETLDYKMKPKEKRNIKNIPIVVNQGEGGVIIHEACGHAFERDNSFNGSFITRIPIDQLFRNRQISLVDDPTLPRLAGSYMIDDEGQQGRKKYLMQSGRIVPSSYLTNLGSVGYDCKMITGNGRRASYQHNPLPRMSNLYLEAGDCSAEEMIAQVPYGMYIKKIGGGQANSLTGDFSYSVKEAYLIEDGKISIPVEPSVFVEKTENLLNSIEVVGNDLKFKSLTCLKQGQLIPCTAGTPTLLINNRGGVGIGF